MYVTLLFYFLDVIDYWYFRQNSQLMGNFSYTFSEFYTLILLTVMKLAVEYMMHIITKMCKIKGSKLILGTMDYWAQTSNLNPSYTCSSGVVS